MSTQSDQHHIPVAYPPTSQAMAPPPLGYPTTTTSTYNHAHAPLPVPTTQSRGDGFWKGCCAALCCCCALDACF